MAEEDALISAKLKLLKISSLKAEQKEAVLSLLHGKDVMAVLPTGFGKSVIFQLFTLLKIDEDNFTSVLIVSPLTSIMEDQIKELEELGISAVKLSDNANILDDISNMRYRVIFGSAEEVLGNGFQKVLSTEAFQKHVKLIVVDECHTVETWGMAKKTRKKKTAASDAFRKDFANLSSLRSFCTSDTPILALTGTSSKKMTACLKKSLAMKETTTCTIFVSPNRENIRLSVVKVKREKYLSNLDWLVSLAKEKREETPKTIVFCNTMQEIASVFGYLLTSLGDHAYATGLSQTPANRIVGLFHSLTWAKYKRRVANSFKSGDGVIRIVVASSALSMGVNYPDVEYVVHLGPARSVIDHIQQAGRAGRNGKLSHNVVIYHGQQLGQCEQHVKEFAKSGSCFRKALYRSLDTKVESVVPLHNCCNNCVKSCNCGENSCDMERLPFEAPETVSEVCTKERIVSLEDKHILKEAVVEYRNSLSAPRCLILDSVTSHGFSEALIEDLMTYCPEIFTLSDVFKKLPVFSITHAQVILEIVNEIFEDVPDRPELMSMVDDVCQMEQLWDGQMYFDSSDSDSDDPDWILTQELENL